MAVDTGVSNLAISHLACSKEIGNVETERSAEALACRRYWKPALDEIQRDLPNPCNIRIEPLALVTDMREVDGAEWSFSYRYPVDCAKAIRIPSGTRNDTNETRVPYRIISDDEGRLILTDKENATLEYSASTDEPSKWAPDFLMAFSLLLASYIAPRVTGGDPFKLGERAYARYRIAKSNSDANAVGEQQDEQPPENDYTRSRL